MKYLIFSLLIFPAFSKTTPELMQNALDAMINLVPYSTASMKYSDPANKDTIKKSLTKLHTNFEQAKHSKELFRRNFDPSYKTILDQIEDAKLQFSAGNVHYSQIKVNQISHLCLSCHTQLPKDRLKKKFVNNENINAVFQEDQYNKANILFILREYQSALDTYYSFVEKRSVRNLENAKTDRYILPEKQLYDNKLYQSVFNSLLIYTKVESSPDKALAYIQKLEKQIDLPNYINSELNKWKKQLNNWKTATPLDKRLEKLKEKPFLNGDHDIDLLMISGLLSQKNMQSSKKVKQSDLLYWLAMAEYRIGKNSFYSLGDIYLKRCIQEFQKTKAAKECFKAYEEEIMFRHTGSGGVFLPKKIKDELESLEKLI